MPDSYGWQMQIVMLVQKGNEKLLKCAFNIPKLVKYAILFMKDKIALWWEMVEQLIHVWSKYTVKAWWILNFDK